MFLFLITSSALAEVPRCGLSISRFYYHDAGGRTIDYGFSSGALTEGLTGDQIEIPASAVLGRGAGESATVFLWEEYSPSMDTEAVLADGELAIRIEQAQQIDNGFEGGWAMGANGFVDPPPSDWIYEVRLSGFEGLDKEHHYMEISVGAGGSGVQYTPGVHATWFTGWAGGVHYENLLMLSASIWDDINDEAVWENQAAWITGWLPSETTLGVRLQVTGGVTFSASYQRNDGQWVSLGQHTMNQGTILGFAGLFPYLDLKSGIFVENAVAPRITSMPQGQTVMVGGSASFTVAATGTEPLSYQWRKDGVDLVETGGGRLTGVQGPTLTISDLELADGGAYTVAVSNAVGNVLSDEAQLVVENAVAPQITSMPQGQTVMVGGSASFTVAATGTEPLSYQWRKDGVDLVETGGGRLTGVQGPTLTISDLELADGGAYTVAVSNAVGSVLSDEAELIVNPIDVTPPALISSIPHDGATAVSTNNTTVAFEFDEPMQATYSVRFVWENLVDIMPNSFVWSPDRRTLTVTFGLLLPDSTFHWTLNATGYGQDFKDLADNVLPADVFHGQFATGSWDLTLVGLQIEIVDGKPHLKVWGMIDETYVIERTESLTEPVAWTAVAEVTISQNPETYVDDAYEGHLRGFYRARARTLALGEFEFIEAGSFQMGDNRHEGYEFDGYWVEEPLHTVYVSGFYMARHEVTKTLWDEVRIWGLTNGYPDLPEQWEGGGGKAPNHPVHSITWYDSVKWCNARSEKEGLTPSYQLSEGVYRSGENDEVTCDWSADGYRLPTEAEWEKAARGGLIGMRFPWGDTIDHSNANYRANGSAFSYDISPYTNFTYHPAFYDELEFPYTSPVGSFTPNEYGLYDMVGNVLEWCWDWWSGNYYSSSPGADPLGPTTSSSRVFRGGCWSFNAEESRCAVRSGYFPDYRNHVLGFRLARSR